MNMKYSDKMAERIQGVLTLLAAFHHINRDDTDAGKLIMDVRSKCFEGMSTGEMLLAIDLGQDVCDRVWQKNKVIRSMES